MIVTKLLRAQFLMLLMAMVGCEEVRIDGKGVHIDEGQPADEPAEQRASPLPAPPQPLTVGTVTYKLREAATIIEGYGEMAQSGLKRQKLFDAQKLYIAATSKHNACISEIVIGLGEDPDEAKLRQLLAAADGARTDFISYCGRQKFRQPRQPRVRGIEAHGAAAGILVDIAVNALSSLFSGIVDLYVRTQELEAENRRAEIARITAELKECSCHSWNEL